VHDGGIKEGKMLREALRKWLCPELCDGTITKKASELTAAVSKCVELDNKIKALEKEIEIKNTSWDIASVKVEEQTNDAITLLKAMHEKFRRELNAEMQSMFFRLTEKKQVSVKEVLRELLGYLKLKADISRKANGELVLKIKKLKEDVK
jgi:hypothetical protein